MVLKKNLLVFSIFFIILAASGFILVNILTKNQTPQSQTEKQELKSLNINKLTKNGLQYVDPEGMYTFQYSLDFTLDTPDTSKQVRLSKTGATQHGQTEMYDGIIILFDKIDLNNNSLDQWIDADIKNKTADGTIKLSSPKKTTSINSYPGYSYYLRSLGEYQIIIVQKDTHVDDALQITIIEQDPQHVGFQTQINKILSSLKLLK